MALDVKEWNVLLAKTINSAKSNNHNGNIHKRGRGGDQGDNDGRVGEEGEERNEGREGEGRERGEGRGRGQWVVYFTSSNFLSLVTMVQSHMTNGNTMDY